MDYEYYEIMRLCFGLDVMVEVSLVEIRNLLDIRNPMTPFMTTEKIIKFKKLLYMYMYMYMYTVVNYPNYICISLLEVYAILHYTRMYMYDHHKEIVFTEI
jgi:hypothetical protein